MSLLLDSIRLRRVESSRVEPNQTHAHHHHVDFTASERIFCKYMTHHPQALAGLDVYSNLLYVQEDEPTLASLAEHASRIDIYSVVTNVILGETFASLGLYTLCFPFTSCSIAFL